MKKALIILGVILIVVGVIAYVTLLIPVSSQTIVSTEAMTVMAGSSLPRAFRLPNDAYVSGTINEVTGGNKDIDFYVFDKTNYNNWISGQSNVRYLFIYRAGSGTPFSFRTDKEDDYYFVFDNPVGGLFGSDRSVNWSASYEYKPYAPYAIPALILLSVIGAVIIVAGYLMKPKQVIPA